MSRRLDEAGLTPLWVLLGIGVVLIGLGEALRRADATVTAFANVTDGEGA